MKYENEVMVPGKIITAPEFSHDYSGVSYYSVNLETYCNKGKKIQKTIVRAYFSGEMIIKDDIKVGKVVKAYGHLVNSKPKGLIDISIVVGSYEFIDSITEEDTSSVTVCGEVTKIFTNKDNYKGFVNFVVEELDSEGKRIFSTRVVIWNRLADYVYNNLQIGDKVMVKGSISNAKTSSKSENKSDNSDPIIVSEVLGLYFSKIKD